MNDKPVFNAKGEHRIIRGINGIAFEQEDMYFDKRGSWVKNKSLGARVAGRPAAEAAAAEAKKRKDAQRVARQNVPTGPTMPDAVIQAAKENAAAAAADDKAD